MKFISCKRFRKVLKPVAYKPEIGSGQIMSPVQLKHASQISYPNVQTASVQTPQPQQQQQQPPPPSLPKSATPVTVLTNNNIIHHQTSQIHHQKQLSLINTSQHQPINPPPHHHPHLTISSHHLHPHHLNNEYVHTQRADGSVYSSPFSSIDSETDSGKLMVNGLNRVETLTTKSNLSQSQASLSHCSGLPGDDDHWYLDPPPPPSSVLKMPPLNWGDLTSLTASRRRPLMYNSSDYLSQTPSPNDSVIVELEALLREKDSEISYLRETLERNEQVIFKVYEEKGQSWEREFKKLKSQYELNLKNYQQRAIRAEQMISLQNKQNQVDREMIEQNYESTRKKVESMEKENVDLKSELTNLKKMVDDLKWTLCERNGEIGLLKTSIRDSKVDLNYRSTELVTLRDKLTETTKSLEESRYKMNNLEKELSSCQDNCNTQIQSMGQRLSELVKQLDEKNRSYDTLVNEKREIQSQLINLKSQLTLEQSKFNKEKEIWADEKEKVLRYQRQLQSNYKKMLNANKILGDLACIIKAKELPKPEESSC